MLIVTTDVLAGYEVRNVLGEVLGTAVRSGQDAHAGGHGGGQGGAPGSSSSGTFRVTGEQPGVGLAALRREAIDRLADDARRRGANAVVGMCFDTAALAGGGHEVCAYGTAVWAEPLQGGVPKAQPAQQHPHGAIPPYAEPQPGGPPMAARNLTIGLHDRPR
ncbi:YbjQ family protein [Actinomadura hibisca]|uniref:YbjQ family protein n=1 Tax=Actinomadura hibisca TaxID=68565 RepID=UPI00083490BF|nr:heavy metal-binding domain-containing protein [Actinomadura hibisca]